MIACGGISLVSLVVCVHLITTLPQMLTVLSPILPASYYRLLILILLFLYTIPPEESNVTCKKSWQVKLSRVRSVLSSLDVKKAIGPDGISSHTLKYCANEMYYPVCLLFRRVCKVGVFPLSWKVSHITPVYKRRVLPLTHIFITQLLSFLHYL